MIGVNPNLLEKIFHPWGDISIVNHFLTSSNITYSTRTTISADAPTVDAKLNELVQNKIGGNYISLIMDGASLKADKAISILSIFSTIQ